MSISGSANELKTAILEVGNDASSAAETSLDAQEDREIVGVSVSASISSNDPSISTVRARVNVGTQHWTDPGTTAGDEATTDNRSYHEQFRFAAQNDNTNQKALHDQGPKGWQRPRGEGFEWNEDATLSLETIGHAGGSTIFAHVYYYEI